MAAEHLVQDWLDRCWLALERARDVEKEERAEKFQERMKEPQIAAETVDEWILKYYGKPLPKDEIVELPKVDQKNPLEKKAYTRVYSHNAWIMRKIEREGYV